MMGGLGPRPAGWSSATLVPTSFGSTASGGRTDWFVDRVVRRSQRSIAVDVKDPRGADLVHPLVAGADAFVDVFRPGALERIGLGPDELLARNPRLIYARMTGYGQDGPLAQMAGHDINYLAMSGALHAIGTAESPVPPLNLVGDYGGGGMLLAVGLLSGVLEARQSGKGQVVDVAMVDGAVTLMAPFYGLLAEGRVGGPSLRQCARRRGPLLPRVRDLRRWPYRRRSNGAAVLRPTDPAGGDRRAAGDAPETWAAHAEVMAERFREKTRAEWEDEIVDPQTCATPVLSLSEAPLHPHHRARGTFVEIDGVVQPSPSPRFSRTKPMPGVPALPGAHTDAILAEFDVDPAGLSGVVRQRESGE